MNLSITEGNWPRETFRWRPWRHSEDSSSKWRYPCLEILESMERGTVGSFHSGIGSKQLAALVSRAAFVLAFVDDTLRHGRTVIRLLP